MATRGFCTPSDGKDTLDRVVTRWEKKVGRARLMRQAVEDRRLRQRRAKAIEKLVALRRGVVDEIKGAAPHIPLNVAVR